MAYVICDDGSSLAATQRAYHVDEVGKDPSAGAGQESSSGNKLLKVDIQYYLAQQLHPVVSRLCEPLDGTDSARIAQSLDLDPEHYRRAVRAEVTADDQSMQRNEEKFRQCQKLTVRRGGSSSSTI